MPTGSMDEVGWMAGMAAALGSLARGGAPATKSGGGLLDKLRSGSASVSGSAISNPSGNSSSVGRPIRPPSHPAHATEGSASAAAGEAYDEEPDFSDENDETPNNACNSAEAGLVLEKVRFRRQQEQDQEQEQDQAAAAAAAAAASQQAPPPQPPAAAAGVAEPGPVLPWSNDAARVEELQVLMGSGKRIVMRQCERFGWVIPHYRVLQIRRGTTA